MDACGAGGVPSSPAENYLSGYLSEKKIYYRQATFINGAASIRHNTKKSHGSLL